MEKNEKLRPPVIAICPFSGWVGGLHSAHPIRDYCQNEFTSAGFHACIENQTFSFDEVVFNASHGWNSWNLSDFKYWSWYMGVPGLPRCYALDYDVLMAVDQANDFLLFHLNHQYIMDYVIYLYEPGFIGMSNNMLAMPTTLTQFRPENNTLLKYFLKTSRRQNLDRPEAACNKMPGYNFTDCVTESLARHIGCTLPWNGPLSGQRLGSRGGLVLIYSIGYFRVSFHARLFQAIRPVFGENLGMTSPEKKVFSFGHCPKKAGAQMVWQ